MSRKDESKKTEKTSSSDESDKEERSSIPQEVIILNYCFFKRVKYRIINARFATNMCWFFYLTFLKKWKDTL